MCASCSCSTTSSGAVSASELSHVVAGMTSSHCIAGVIEELTDRIGVRAVDADPGTKLVRVRGTDLDDRSVRAAIETAGDEGVPA